MQRNFLAVGLVLVFGFPSDAGFFFKRSSRPEPAVYVPALVQTLRTDKDERAREFAASQLKDYDAKAFPDILPALSEALMNDPCVAVRVEAATSIGKIRPISTQAGYALEQAVANDKSPLVRLAAQTALLKYKVLGFFSGKQDLALQTAEPPLAASTQPTGTGNTVLRPTPAPPPDAGPALPPAVPSSAAPAGPAVVAPLPSPQTSEPPLSLPLRPEIGVAAQSKPSAVPVITIPAPTRDSMKTRTASDSTPRRLPDELIAPPRSADDGPRLPPRKS